MDKIKTLLGSYRQITLEPVFLLFCVNLGLIGITTQADLQALLDVSQTVMYSMIVVYKWWLLLNYIAYTSGAGSVPKQGM